MFRRLRSWLRNSPRVHIREQGVTSMADLVDLIDRFIDGPMRYDLEWDDFISWTHSNPNIERIRNCIGDREPLLFSKKPADRARYLEFLIVERDRAAALCGLPARPQKTHS